LLRNSASGNICQILLGLYVYDRHFALHSIQKN